jgi:septum formation protein
VDLILASTSPRRAALLAAAGISFQVEAPDIDETPEPQEFPERYVVRLALAKARTVARRCPGRLVLAADTCVVIEERILGKPETAPEATQMLELLSDRLHDVVTGVALALDAREATSLARTRVQFVRLTPGEVAWYVDSGEPFGKAGGYAIQGLASRFVDSIEGSYTNVVGLPVGVAYRLLRAWGWPCVGSTEGLESR